MSQFPILLLWHKIKPREETLTAFRSSACHVNLFIQQLNDAILVRHAGVFIVYLFIYLTNGQVQELTVESTV